MWLPRRRCRREVVEDRDVAREIAMTEQQRKELRRQKGWRVPAEPDGAAALPCVGHDHQRRG